MEGFEEWVRDVESYLQRAELPQAATLDDVNKEGVVEDVRIIQTRYGDRLAVILTLPDQTKRTVWLSKFKYARLYNDLRNRGLMEDPNPKNLIGKRLRIVLLSIQLRSGETKVTISLGV